VKSMAFVLRLLWRQWLSEVCSQTWILWLVTIILCASGHFTFAQANTLGDEGARPVAGVGHNYIYGVAETVSPSNGTLNIKINLPTPKGRGLSFPFALIYNSGSAHRFTSALAGCGGMDGSQCASSLITDRSQAGSGWSDTLPYATASVWSIISASPPQGPGITADCDITSSYNFYDLSGGSHPLGLAAISPPVRTAGQVGPDVCAQLRYSNNYGFGSSASGGDDEVTAQAESNCTGIQQSGQPDCASAAPSFKVTDLNGTVYSFPANSFFVEGDRFPTAGGTPVIQFLAPTTIEDRNGNIIALTTSNNYSGGGLPIVDTAGRQIVSANSASGPIASYASFLGVPTSYTVGGLTYGLTFTSTTSNYTPASTQVDIPSNVTCATYFTVADAAHSVVHTITAPNGGTYTFFYDSTYGLVNEIDYPDGGKVVYTWKLSDTKSTLATFDGNQTGEPPVSGACNFEYQTPVIATRTVYNSVSSKAQT
jgi:hypothetical protein